MIAGALACAASAAAAQEQTPAPAGISGELCGVLQTSAESSAFVPVAGYSILAASAPLSAPPGQTDIDAIMCLRNAVFIGPVDHRVLTDLHVPLYIRTVDRRMAVLELADGQLRVRFAAGEPLPAETEAMRAALDRAQQDMASHPH
mgnify:CR=1 FL=1